MTDVTLQEVSKLRKIVARLDEIVLQLGRSLGDAHADPRPTSTAGAEALEHESARLMAILRAHPPPKPRCCPQRRLRLAAAQGWRCAICCELLPDAFDADHRIPWADCFDDSDANIQIVCHAPCHLAKTSAESAARRRPAPRDGAAD